MENREKKYNLEERLIDFSLVIIEIYESLYSTFPAKHVGGQMLRSGTSPAFNYGEAQVAESQDDFIHKMKICIKELNETKIALKIILRKPLSKNLNLVENASKEYAELLAVFAKSIQTAKYNKTTAKSKFKQ